MKITVWFSCGAASAVAAIRTIQLFGEKHDVRIVNNPVAEEHEDNQRFKYDVERFLGVNIETAINPKWPHCSAEIVWRKEKFMSSPWGAPCTKHLKKRARQHWEKHNASDCIVLGFTQDEVKRYQRFITTERKDVFPVLIEEGITKAACVNYLRFIGIKPSIMYDLGHPNANCIGCVKSKSVAYWSNVKAHHPKIFKDRAELSRCLGCKLIEVRGERLYLDQLSDDAPTNDNSDDEMDCGIFCEEK